MKTATTSIEAITNVNDDNEIQPTQYVIKENGRLVVVTCNFVYAMQCFINRVGNGTYEHTTKNKT